MSKEANSSKHNKKRHHRKKKCAVIQYFTLPLIFTLIAMIVIAPTCFGGMKIAISTVHDAQKVLTKDFNDVEPIFDYEPSNVKTGSVEIPSITVAQKIGVISCKRAGLYTDAFYGINRVSLRNGAGVDSTGKLCGNGSAVQVYGYVSSSFKALPNLEIGDIVSFETLWGSYSYKVKAISVSKNVPSLSGKEQLVLATEKDKQAFSSFDDEKLYVVCDKVTGPNAEEVQL